jgi:2-methylisocitrate lyase-like PEP mutase family enzyme
VARTDASDRQQILERVAAYSDSSADAILFDGIGDMNLLSEIRSITDKPLAFNQIVGGASPPRSLDELRNAGISLPIFSTPCLFAAQAAMEETLERLKADCSLAGGIAGATLNECNEFLVSNLRRRDTARQSTSQ